MTLPTRASKFEPAQPRPHKQESMKALVWKGVAKVAVEELPRPAIGEAHEAIVRITSTTICGSDLHLYHGSLPAMREGDILGHECMGIVDEVGAEVKDLREGDRVVVSAIIADGTCWFCQQGLFSACDGTNQSAVIDNIEAVGFSYVKSLHHRVQKTLKLETARIDALNECIRSCRKYGWLSIVGDFVGHANQFPIGAFMEKGLQAGAGQVNIQRYGQHLLEIIARGDFDPTFVVSHRWRLERAAEAYDMFDVTVDEAVKVLLAV